MVQTKERIVCTAPVRLKRRLKEVAEDKDITVNELMITAITDYLDRLDGRESAPDLVLDRMNQLLNSQMMVITQLNELTFKIAEKVGDYDE